MLTIPFPRLLPVTIIFLAAVLVLKLLVLADLVRPEGTAATPLLTTGVAVVSTAHAATPAGEAAGPKAPAPGPGPAPAMPDAMPMTALPVAAAPVAKPSEPPPVSDSERAVLLDLRQRRRELDAREGGLASREAILVAAEHRLSARIDELTALQARLEALDQARKDREESNWRGLVKIYEDMKPRDAAAIFNGLDMAVLLEVLDRMKEGKSAPILAGMTPEKARQATIQLAQMRLKHNSIGG